MPTLAHDQPMVIRTDRGLILAGTRITIYDVMDYVAAGWPSKLIRDRLQLTDLQIASALAYIETHLAAVEREYQSVLQTAAENRRYWEERNREMLSRSASSPPNPDHAELRARLQEWNTKRRRP